MIAAKTESILLAAGWYEGRDTDIADVTTLLTNAGYTVSDHVQTFLREFEGLEFSFSDGIGAQLWLSFDITWTLNNEGFLERRLIREDYVQVIGCKYLTIIGRMNTVICIVISDEGIIYSLYDGLIYEAGKGIEAINELVTGSHRTLKVIPNDNWRD